MTSWAISALLGAVACSGGGDDTRVPGDDTAVEKVPAEPFLVPTGDSPPANLLIISIDTLRRDRLGFLGSPGTTPTPFLDGLAADGVVLANHVACANWTTPTMICAQTGRTTLQVGFHPDKSDLEEVYDQAYPTLEHFFNEEGFTTALTTTNSFFSALNGTTASFQQQRSLPYELSAVGASAALGQLEERVGGGTPFYQHLHLVDPHTPYTAAETWWRDHEGLDPLAYDLTSETGINDALAAYSGMDETDQAALRAWFDVVYQADLREMDANIATFLDDARALGALENTLVVFYSDHGEQLWEDDLFGHGRSLHDEEADSFALFWMDAGGLEPGVWTGPTAGLDLPPTLMQVMGLPASEDYMGSVVGTAPVDRRRLSVHWQHDTSELSMSSGGWKLIYHWDGTLKLYDRNTDPSEEIDVVDQEPDKARELYGMLRKRVQDLYALHPWSGAPVEPPP